jgi:hypothetical protein
LQWLVNRIWRPFKPGTDWVTEGIEKVTVFIPVGGVGKYISNGNITIGGKKIQGYPGAWVEHRNVEVRLAKSTMKVEMAGAMREPLHMYDENGTIFKKILIQYGLTDLDPCRLIYKRYNNKNKAKIEEYGDTISGITFRDAYMQFRAQCFANEFNKRVANKSDRVAFAPVAVMLYKDEYYSVECYLHGHYKKYNNNHLWPEALLSHDDIPGCFSHFTYEHTQCNEIVTDIQGIESSKGSLRYIFTDPQIHAPSKIDEYGRGNRSNLGMDEFFKGHICGRSCKGMGLKNHAIKMMSRAKMKAIEKKIRQDRLNGLKIVVIVLIMSLMLYLLEMILANYVPAWNFFDVLIAKFMEYWYIIIIAYQVLLILDDDWKKQKKKKEENKIKKS